MDDKRMIIVSLAGRLRRQRRREERSGSAVTSVRVAKHLVGAIISGLLNSFKLIFRSTVQQMNVTQMRGKQIWSSFWPILAQECLSYLPNTMGST